jgi:hypothetical protein
MAMFQDITEPIITPLSKNCKWNIDIDKMATNCNLILDKNSMIEIQAGTMALRIYSKVISV